MTPIPFLDLARQTRAFRSDLDAAIARVLDSGRYVMSEEVDRFEEAFARFCGTRHAVGVGSGTDAITIALLAAGVEPGDEVITAANTCVPTIVGIERAGARPVLADVDPITYTLDPADVERRVTTRTRAVLPVHLYGQPADMGALSSLADAHGLLLIEDSAQAHGASWNGRSTGALGLAAAFSFYPTKNLGALGDAGAVTTDDDGVAERARLLRNYGERERFEHVVHGLNSRLDPLQAAILGVKLARLAEMNERRRVLAARYDEAFEGTPLVVPRVGAGRSHAFHLYVVQAPDRRSFRNSLAEAGIGTAVHYPRPVHRQPAYSALDSPGGYPVAETLCDRIVSLPLSETHSDDEIATVADAAARAAAVSA